MRKTIFVIFTLILISCTGYTQKEKKSNIMDTTKKTEAEWKAILSPQQYYVLREKGTDAQSSGGYTSHFEKGTYHCAACNQQLFESGSKFESHCGWPSFDDAIKGTVKNVVDKSHGMFRTEIICTKCDGHLGHVFDDGPKETTGLRYCVNTSSIKFVKSNE